MMSMKASFEGGDGSNERRNWGTESVWVNWGRLILYLIRI